MAWTSANIKLESSATIVNGKKLLTNAAKFSMLGVHRGPGYASGYT